MSRNRSPTRNRSPPRSRQRTEAPLPIARDSRDALQFLRNNQRFRIKDFRGDGQQHYLIGLEE